MIQRKTIILFLLFLVLLVGTIYINQDSNLQVSLGLLTATPTSLPNLTSGFSFSDVTQIEIQSTDKSGPNLLINQNEKGNWFTKDNQYVSLSAVFSIVQNFSSIKLEGSVNANPSLDSVGLSSPKNKIILRNKSGKESILLIGNKTVTQSSYYVKWNDSPISIASGNEIDMLIGSFSYDTLLVNTPTPQITPTSETTNLTATPVK